MADKRLEAIAIDVLTDALVTCACVEAGVIREELTKGMEDIGGISSGIAKRYNRHEAYVFDLSRDGARAEYGRMVALVDSGRGFIGLQLMDKVFKDGDYACLVLKPKD